MTTFYVCRHGQTENNKHHRLSGWIDTPLTSYGLENAHVAARKLYGIHIDKVISSDLGRAFITAYIISKDLGYNAEITRLSELREVNYGDIANTSVSGPGKRYPELSSLDNGTYVPPNGESLEAMQRRILSCFNELNDPDRNESVLVVCHDGSINALYASFTDQNIGVVDASSNNPHDLVAKITVESGRISSFSVLGE